MASDEPAGLSFDCVIPAHEKDLQTLEHTVTSLRQCCPAVKRVIIISAAPLAEATPADAEWLDEAAELWPFRRADLEGRGCQPGWLLQQLLKLHAPLLIPDLAPHVLVCDADVVWLQAGGLRFFEPGGVAGPVALPCTFGAEALFQRVEAAHDGRPFWEVFRDATQACEGRASEYELYHAFAHRLFPQRTSPRPLAFAVVADVEAALRCPPAPALAFLVAHSHLRGLAPEELRDREGIINGNVHVEIARRLAQGHPPELAALLAGSGMF